ncbi:MAG: hypothetical protein JRJ29_11150 [Deltaproteobacteria bacterium]|nr:hypothetical protein [Deltaproteobacteria bacterium]
MNPQTNMDFCVIDHSRPFETERVWKIVRYGEEYPTHESGDLFHEKAMVSSAAGLFEVFDLSLTGNVTLVTSGTSSDINVDIPEIPWFINDKAHRIIVFNQKVCLPQETTWASCIDAELPKWSIETRFNQTFQRIGRFAAFPENWDSYGAKAIDRECISQGVSIFKELLKLRSLEEGEIPAPFVAPLSSGGIQIEWEEGERYIEVSITPDPLSVDYFATDKAREGQLSLEGPLRSTSALKALLTWFVSGTAEDLAQLTFEEPHEEWAF